MKHLIVSAAVPAALGAFANAAVIEADFSELSTGIFGSVDLASGFVISGSHPSVAKEGDIVVSNNSGVTEVSSLDDDFVFFSRTNDDDQAEDLGLSSITFSYTPNAGSDFAGANVNIDVEASGERFTFQVFLDENEPIKTLDLGSIAVDASFARIDFADQNEGSLGISGFSYLEDAPSRNPVPLPGAVLLFPAGLLALRHFRGPKR